jgi:peptide/nickel transport system substrate-binding protein
LAGRPKEERVMTIIQQQLSNVGVEVELNIIQPSVYWSGEGVRSFKDMLGMVVGIGDVDPYMSHWRQFGTPGKMPNMGSAQFSLWFHDEYDKLIMEDYRTAKQKDRKQVLRDSLDILMEEAPIAMTVFPTLPRVTNQKLKNVGIQAGLNNFHRAYLTN